MILRIIPLLFLAFPLVEIAGLIIVGREIGLLATLGLVIAGAIIGGALLRIRGIGIIRRLQQAVATGQDAGRELLRGAATAVAALLFIIPGFVSDIAAILLLVPFIRERGLAFLFRGMKLRRTAHGFQSYSGDVRPSRTEARPTVIDLEADEFTHDDGTTRRPPRGDDRLT